jgi:hypothetical protein
MAATNTTLAWVPAEMLFGRTPGGGYPRLPAAALLISVRADDEGDPSGLGSVVLWVDAVLSPDGARRARGLLGRGAPIGKSARHASLVKVSDANATLHGKSFPGRGEGGL